MGWLKDLFQKKPGGTKLGNLFRKIGDAYTAGMYSYFNPAEPCRQNSYGLPDGLSSFIFDGTCRSSARGSAQRGGLGSFGGGFSLPDFGDFDLPDFGSEFNSPPIITPTNNDNNNPFGLPDQAINIFNDLLTGLDLGTVDINNIPQTTINILDNALGDTIPPQIANLLGITPDTMEPIQGSPEWLDTIGYDYGQNNLNNGGGSNIGGNIGGVEFEVNIPGSGTDQEQADQEQETEKLTDKVLAFAKKHATNLIIGTLATIGSAFVLIKKFR